ncbi:MAG: DUF2500 domain-containing protein [Clostridia bacterium]|nr:DUF2500 domain-containing protein [Clostridia bacterium]
MFSIVPVVVTVGFVVILGVMIVLVIKGLLQWGKNNRSPVLTVDAELVTKRTDVSHRHSGTDDTMMHSTSTYYYATFQVGSGDRMEFPVSSSEFGMLVEGDKGKLTFQGTRYQGFERERY